MFLRALTLLRVQEQSEFLHGPFSPSCPPSLGTEGQELWCRGREELWPPSPLGVLCPGCAAGLWLLLGAAASTGQSLDEVAH